MPYWPVVAAAAVVGLIGASFLGWWLGRGADAPARPLSLYVGLPPGHELTDDLAVAIAPDGSQIVYSARDGNGTPRLYRRPLDRDEAIPIAGTEGASAPFFSPDGRSVAFLAGTRLQKVGVAGGAVLPICEVPSGELQGGAWLADGTIVFSAGISSGLLAVDGGGGDPEVLTEPDPEALERGHWYPSPLPGRRAVLFFVDGASFLTAVFDLDQRRRSVVVEGVNAQYVADGVLVFRRGPTLMAAPFDLAALRTTGPPRPVPQRISPHPEGAGFTVSRDGAIVSADAPGRGGVRLVLMARDGSAEPLSEERASYGLSRMSPDGRWVASGEDLDIVLHDLERGSRQPFVVPGLANIPVWSPDSRMVAFVWTTSASRSLAVQSLGESEPTPLYESFIGGPIPNSWARDGRYLVFHLQRPQAGRDLWVLPMDGEGEAPFPYLATPYNERAAALSPDARWIAYVSNTTGIDEVYLAPFPEHGERRWQVSAGGGLEPLWSADGRELTYRHGDDLLAVEVDAEGAEPTLGRAERLFHLPYPPEPQITGYDRTPDGRFLVRELPKQGVERMLISFGLLEERQGADR